MRKDFMLITLAAVAVAWNIAPARAQTSTDAQNPTASTQGPAATAAGTTISAVLDKSVDAKKAKVGDQVQATTTADGRIVTGAVIPRGAKLMGRVTEVKAHEKGSANAQSTLGIQFERAVVKGGEAVPIHGVIQAIAAPAQAPMASSAPDMSGGGPSGGYGQGGLGQGGYGTPAPTASRGTVGTAGQPASPASGPRGGVPGATDGTTSTVGTTGGAAAGQLPPNATGVVGIKDLRLDQSQSAQAPVISSDIKNVKLDSGTQLLVRVTPQ